MKIWVSTKIVWEEKAKPTVTRQSRWNIFNRTKGRSSYQYRVKIEPGSLLSRSKLQHYVGLGENTSSIFTHFQTLSNLCFVLFFCHEQVNSLLVNEGPNLSCRCSIYLRFGSMCVLHILFCPASRAGCAYLHVLLKPFPATADSCVMNRTQTPSGSHWQWHESRCHLWFSRT